MGFLVWPWDPWPDLPERQDGADPAKDSDAAEGGGKARVDKARELGSAVSQRAHRIRARRTDGHVPDRPEP